MSSIGKMEEESFVILGSSPFPSLITKEECVAQNSVVVPSNLSSSSPSLTKGIANDATTKNSTTVEPQQSSEPIMINSTSTLRSEKRNESVQSSLAASFILGEIGADALKTSVYSQFPSICSMENCSEDVVKLQGFFHMYEELKNALTKANESMKLFYNKWNKEHNERLSKEDYYEKQLQSLQTQIASLRNENIDLRRDINTKVEQISMNVELNEKEHTKLIQQISEKTAQIQNMRSVIEKFEREELASFECMPRTEDDSKDKPDYAERAEHEEFKRQISQLLAENLDLKDVQKQYIDELTCLKVNCTAAEELVIQLRADIALLKSKDIEKSDIFSKFEQERDQMREEITILQQQIEVYSKDFEMERNARQNLAGEKDQLLQDLRSLQRKNQELIERAQKELDQQASSTSGHKADMRRDNFIGNDKIPIRQPLPSKPHGAPIVNNFCCPICYKAFDNLSSLEHHVNSCLKDP